MVGWWCRGGGLFGPQERLWLYSEWDGCHGGYGAEERWDLACFQQDSSVYRGITVCLGARWKQEECGLKIKAMEFSNRSDLGWERRETAGMTPMFWKDRAALHELRGCKRSSLRAWVLFVFLRDASWAPRGRG